MTTLDLVRLIYLGVKLAANSALNANGYESALPGTCLRGRPTRHQIRTRQPSKLKLILCLLCDTDQSVATSDSQDELPKGSMARASGIWRHAIQALFSFQ